jgi:hypothetical protein
MTPYEKSFEISKEAEARGLIIRYDTISYRGQEVTFLSDPNGNQCVAQWNGELVDLGLHNLHYKEDMCRIIDHRLDFITDFRNSPNFVGAKLEYFRNGDYRDIKLSYKGRILKVFLVAGSVDETLLISESERILLRSGLFEDNNI